MRATEPWREVVERWQQRRTVDVNLSRGQGDREVPIWVHGFLLGGQFGYEGQQSGGRTGDGEEED